MGRLVGPDGVEVECSDTLNEKVKVKRVLVYEGTRWWVRVTLNKSIQEKLETSFGTITVESQTEEEVK